jgi:sortase A
MKPNEPNSSQSGLPLSQQGLSANVPLNQTNIQPSRDAAAQIIRSQIDNLYASSDNPTVNNATPQPQFATQPEPQPTPIEDVNPYQKTHSQNPSLQNHDWSQYHSAWQNYYQKYYQGYYTHHLEKTRQTLENQQIATNSNPTPNSITPDNNKFFPNTPKSQSEPIKTPLNDEEIFDLRQEIIGKVNKSATKIKKSRHFIPIISGIIVVLIFLFLQYNRLILSNVMAYISPGNIDPQNIVIDPTTELTVQPEPLLIIPKINVDVPVIYDIGNDYDSQMAAMTKGVAQFAIPGANSHPGQIGNTVIAGHSSNDLLDPGDYKFIFAQLDRLNVGDTIYANYNSKRYTYSVTKKEVVKPTDVDKLVYPTTKPILTLLTCTPVGTSVNRLLVTAEQISPDPNKSTAAPDTTKSTTKSIPGNSQTFFERIFGLNKN